MLLRKLNFHKMKNKKTLFDFNETLELMVKYYTEVKADIIGLFKQLELI